MPPADPELPTSVHPREDSRASFAEPQPSFGSSDSAPIPVLPLGLGPRGRFAFWTSHVGRRRSGLGAGQLGTDSSESWLFRQAKTATALSMAS